MVISWRGIVSGWRTPYELQSTLWRVGPCLGWTCLEFYIGIIITRRLLKSLSRMVAYTRPLSTLAARPSKYGLCRGPKGHLNTRISHAGGAAQYEGIPETMVCRILMFVCRLLHTIYHLRHAIYHKPFCRILMFRWSAGSYSVLPALRPWRLWTSTSNRAEEDALKDRLEM